jgi:hypothetical protein
MRKAPGYQGIQETERNPIITRKNIFFPSSRTAPVSPEAARSSGFWLSLPASLFPPSQKPFTKLEKNFTQSFQ